MNRRFLPRVGSIHYAWIVFAVTFITLLAASGTRSTPGVLMVPLEGEFGWSRATISLAVSINLVLFGFVGPFAAAMMDRWGIRPVVTGALLFIAGGAALTTLMTLPWQLYLLWGIVVGLGTGTMATVFAATVANRWFVRRRGLVVGLLTAASATGQLIFLPFLGWLAQERGWRYVSLTVAICTLAVVPLVLVFLRNRPRMPGPEPTVPARMTHRRQRAETRSRRPFAGWPWRAAIAISGYWRRRSSSAAPRPTASSART